MCTTRPDECKSFRSGQVRSVQVRSGQVRSSQVSSVHISLNALLAIYNHLTKLAIQAINETTYRNDNVTEILIQNTTTREINFM